MDREIVAFVGWGLLLAVVMLSLMWSERRVTAVDQEINGRPRGLPLNPMRQPDSMPSRPMEDMIVPVSR